MNKRSSAAAMPTMMLRGHGKSRKSVSTALVPICGFTNLDHIIVGKIKHGNIKAYH